jgi:hypothetical protein
MGRWRTHAEAWLAAEERGHDEAAEAALEPVFAALPAVEPSAAFVARAVEAAWAARRRRARLVALGSAAAAVVFAATGVIVLSAVLGGRAAWLLPVAASAASGIVLSLLSAGVTAAGWWSAAADAGLALAAAFSNPYGVAALTVVELVAVGALAALHRLLRSEVDFRVPHAYCA